jgi:hypothetical protein
VGLTEKINVSREKYRADMRALYFIFGLNHRQCLWCRRAKGVGLQKSLAFDIIIKVTSHIKIKKGRDFYVKKI